MFLSGPFTFIVSLCSILTLMFYLLANVGPNLNGLFGRQSGTTAGYSYSAANKSMAVIWEEKALYDYLLNPKKVLDPNYCFYTEWLFLNI